MVIGLKLSGPPTVSAGGPYAVIEGTSVLLSATGSDPDGDALSYAWDLDNETTGQSLNFSAAGIEAPATRTVSVKATDPSGASATASATVQVIFRFTGFFSPVANFPAFNNLNSGQAIPIKFSLSGNQGLDIFAAGYPKWEVIPCGSSVEVNGTTTANSNSGLTYDAGSDQYSFVWKTDKSWTNSCRQLVVKLVDGMVYRANFNFVK